MNWIPPGKFVMGSPSAELDRKPTEGPPTTVTFPEGFWAGRYEVDVMNDNPSKYGRSPPAPDRYPVEKVSWLKAREFVRLLNEREQAARRVPPGYEYRLPTEAEWEYFARAGATTPFTFGDRATPANGNFRSSYPADAAANTPLPAPVIGTKPVGSYEPNAWGLYDVHGNVAEWVADAYKSRLPGGDVTAPALQAGDDSARRI
jgi:formylglycine-generating enzyme required for sulfatase activity